MKILYLDLDTLRPDHLGCYGYPRNTSPNIDLIAADGIRFNHYHCSDAPCLPSRAAYMTGRFGIHTGVINHGGTAADLRLEGETRVMQDQCYRYNLPSVLRNYGHYTALVSPFAERHSAYWFYAGFNEIHNTGKKGLESAEEITPVILRWIRNNKDRKDWYLHVNYWDAHIPYRAPASFQNPFEHEPHPAEQWVTDDVFEQHKLAVGPHCAMDQDKFDDGANPAYPRVPGRIETREDWKTVMDNYDMGIRYIDHHIGLILDALRDANGGSLDDIAIIISADHGENFGELGIYGDHATADEFTTRIPMIIKWPDGCKNIADNELHYNVDWIPTVMDLLGEMPAQCVKEKVSGVPQSYNYDGKSYAETVLQGKPCGRDYLVLSQCSHVCQRSVRFEEWIYIRTYHDGYHLFDQEMLFNLRDDPYETVNLAAQHRDVVHKAAYLMQQWHTEQMMCMSPGCQIDPLWTVMAEGGPFHAKGHLNPKKNIKNYCNRLQATGRGWAIPLMMARHPEHFD